MALLLLLFLQGTQIMLTLQATFAALSSSEEENLYEGCMVFIESPRYIAGQVETFYQDASLLELGTYYAKVPSSIKWSVLGGEYFQNEEGEEISFESWIKNPENQQAVCNLNWLSSDLNHEVILGWQDREKQISQKVWEEFRSKYNYLEEFLPKVGKKFSSVDIYYDDSDNRRVSYEDSVLYTEDSASYDAESKFISLHWKAIKKEISKRLKA